MIDGVSSSAMSAATGLAPEAAVVGSPPNALEVHPAPDDAAWNKAASIYEGLHAEMQTVLRQAIPPLPSVLTLQSLSAYMSGYLDLQRRMIQYQLTFKFAEEVGKTTKKAVSKLIEQKDQ